mgnify:CR=1 FL=1
MVEDEFQIVRRNAFLTIGKSIEHWCVMINKTTSDNYTWHKVFFEPDFLNTILFRTFIRHSG